MRLFAVILTIILTISSRQYAMANYDDMATTNEMDKLFSKTRYDRRLRPYRHSNTIDNITVGLTVVHFGQIREKDMDFSLDVFFYQKWEDPRLRHSLSQPIHLGGEFKSLVWLPDTFFLNIKTAKFHNVPSDNSKISIYPNGTVRYSTRLTLTAGCEMNLLDYPLDEQICNLTILSYAFPTDELDYYWDGDTQNAIDVLNDAMNEFVMNGINTSKEVFFYVTGPWSHLMLMFSFQRRLGYSIIQVYAPTILIVALSWLSFWISKDAAPARVALGITTVLTIVTLMGSFRASVPKVSYIKAIDMFFIVSFLFVFGAVMEYVAVLLHSAMKEHSKERQDKQEIEMQNLMGQSEDHELLKENGEQKTPRPDSATSPSLSNSSSVHQRKRSDTPPRRCCASKGIVRFAFIEQDADIIDRISRGLFPAGYIFFNIVYWMYYALNTFGTRPR